MKSFTFVVFFSSLPLNVLANPFVFVQAHLSVRTNDQSQFDGVGVKWTYDSGFSHLLTHQVAPHVEGEVALNATEMSLLRAFVLDWPAEFSGDLHVSIDGVSQPLGPPENGDVTMVDGHVQETHFRPLNPPVSTDKPVTVQLYDPLYYTAYALDPEITFEGPMTCSARTVKADLDAAHDLASSLLGGRQAGDVTSDEYFPPIGDAFSDRIIIFCTD